MKIFIEEIFQMICTKFRIFYNIIDDMLCVSVKKIFSVTIAVVIILLLRMIQLLFLFIGNNIYL